MILASLLLVFRFVRVIDGDTIVVGKTHVRLVGINAPEIAHPALHIAEQCYGPEATQRMKELLRVGDHGAVISVRVVSQGKDKYGRTLGVVMVGGMDLGAEMLREGMAELYRSRHPKAYEPFEANARAGGLGKWGVCK